jgi:hypothetical protein
MSTRCTIGYGDGYHLYEECFDQDKVWLELEGKVSEVEYSSIHDGCLVVGIDVATWRALVESWLKSHWGNNVGRDHKEPKIDLEYFNEIVENAKKNKEKKDVE